MNILIWLWQFPQHLLALLIMRIMRKRYMVFVSGIGVNSIIYGYRAKKEYWGVSLGEYIILVGYTDITTCRHECGHAKQSLYFGPLYLILIGIPSIIRAVVSYIFSWSSKTYYSGYPEKWADELGGVQRG